VLCKSVVHCDTLTHTRVVLTVKLISLNSVWYLFVFSASVCMFHVSLGILCILCLFLSTGLAGKNIFKMCRGGCKILTPSIELRSQILDQEMMKSFE